MSSINTDSFKLNEVGPLRLTAATGDTPVGVAVDPASRFVVVTNSGSNDLSVYAIAATGRLTPVGATIPTGGSGPTSAVFVQH